MDTGILRPDPDPAWQARQGIFRAATPILNFEGISNRDNRDIYPTKDIFFAPPDVNIDVGPNHIVQMVNSSFAVWDKQGNLLLGPAPNKALFAGFGGACTRDVSRIPGSIDPIVVYDHLADRWLLSYITHVLVDPGCCVCIAISETGDPTGAYFRYSFPIRSRDYPKLGVWPDGYYISLGNLAGAFEREKMLNGDPTAKLVLFTGPGTHVLPADLDGPAPPVGTAGLFLGHQDDVLPGVPEDRLVLFELTLDWNNPNNSAFLGPISIPTDPFSAFFCGDVYGLECIPQPSPGERLTASGFAMMHRLAFRNFGTHLSMVANHSVNVGGNHAGIRWYELRNSGSGWGIHQQGTYAPDADHRWMGSIAMNANGDIALGYTVSSESTFPSIRYTGRTPDAPVGEMNVAEQSIVEGTGAQLRGPSANHGAWGDYSAVVVDPSDDATFWLTHEYYAETSANNWRTRIAAFKIKGIAVGPPTIDFGLVAIDDSSTVAIAIRSFGPDSLKVTSISSPGTPFTLTNLPTLPTVIPAGGSETFDVIFSPPSPGIVNGTITIASNDSDDPTVDVTLSGQGVETALLSGAVRDSRNNAAITATLEFIRQGEATPRAIITTNSDGFYDIVVIVGTYDINILAEFPYLQARRENIEHSSSGTMFDILLPPPPQIALVEDDSTGSAGEIIRNFLGELGFEPAVWNPIEQGRIVPVDRINLLAEPRILFWLTGEVTTNALTAAERSLIIEHLDNGNSLILSGNNIAEFAQTNDALMTSYLGVTFNTNISPGTVKGFTNDPIGDGLSMFVPGSSKDQLQLSASPIGQINKVFSYGSSEKDSIRIAAVRAQNPDKGWKAVYFGFGVADILTSTNRKKVIQRSIDWIIDSVLVSVEYPDIATLPLTFHLEQNYPNPFNPETTISFSLANSSVVEVTIYNVLGQKIRELVNERYSAGEHFVKWDGRDAFGSTVSSGVYLYKLQTVEFTALRKLVLLK